MADYLYINDTGVIIADTESVLAEVQQEYKDVFGEDLNVAPSTPQGLLITTDTITRKQTADNNAALSNQINPNIAGGIFLDAICALTALSRAAATRSTIDSVTVTGVPGAIIPEGSQAKTTSNELFKTTGAVVLPITGTTTVNFESVEFGAIDAAANTLTSIVTPVIGWETVDNDNAAVLGVDNQSDLSLRALRKNTLALQGISLTEARISGLYATEGVRSVAFRENVYNTTQTIDGIVLVAHSIWACVDGGTDTDIAETLYKRKSDGAAWNGDVEVEVIDSFSGQTFTVLFDRPTPIPVYARVSVKVNSALLSPTTAITNAIIDYANGNIDGEPGFVVGGSVSPFELAAAVNSQVPGIYVQLFEISDDGISWQTTQIDIALDEIATIISDNIEVIIL